MTVSILSTAEKAVVGQLYKQRFYTMTDIAKHYGVSTTTIHAVLRELGITKKRAVLSVEQGQVLHFVKAHALSLNDLYSVFGPIETKGIVPHAS
jgi:sulfur carrier protein ThiS